MSDSTPATAADREVQELADALRPHWPEPTATAAERPCDECCWTPFCPDHRLRQDNDGSRCRACNGTGMKR